MQVLVFQLDESRFGLRASDVVEIVRAVRITPLPKAPEVIEGVVDVRGAIVPVLDLRRRFRRSLRALDAAEHLVIALTVGKRRGIRVDRALDVIDVNEAAIRQAQPADRVDYVAGIATLDDGLLLIHDLATFLDEAESLALDEALRDA